MKSPDGLPSWAAEMKAQYSAGEGMTLTLENRRGARGAEARLRLPTDGRRPDDRASGASREAGRPLNGGAEGARRS